MRERLREREFFFSHTQKLYQQPRLSCAHLREVVSLQRTSTMGGQVLEPPLERVVVAAVARAVVGRVVVARAVVGRAVVVGRVVVRGRVWVVVVVDVVVVVVVVGSSAGHALKLSKRDDGRQQVSTSLMSV